MKHLMLLLGVILTIQLPAQLSKTVEPLQPGTLSTYISLQEKTTVTSLILRGKLDARDFAFLRDEMKSLATLNLSSASIYAYTGDLGTVKGSNLSYPANELPAFAFYNPVLLTYKPELTSVTLPANAVSIGDQAFYFCWNLTSMTIPNSVKKIGEYAFYGCYALNAYTVASSHTRFVNDQYGILYNKTKDTLFSCPNARIGNLTLPATVKHIANSAFENCYNLTAVALPTSLLSTGTYAFANCSGISGNLSLPASLQRISDGSFYGCYNLTGTVTFPSSLTDVGSYSFFGINDIQSFTVNTSNPRFSSRNGLLFSKQADTLFICPAGKSGTVAIPSTVRYIGSHAFYGCSKLTGTLSIPASTDYISFYAFNGCTSLTGIIADASNPWFSSENGILYSKSRDRILFCPTSFTGTFQLPASVLSLDPGAFSNCTGITGPLVFPASLSWIGEYAFYNCPGITGFEVQNENPWYSTHEGLLYNKNTDTLYICPLSKSGTYTLPSTVKHIGTAAFSGCTGITGFSASPSLRSIGASAFAGCTALQTVHLPSNTLAMGYGAFYNCNSLTSFSIAQPTPPVIDYFTFELANQNNAQLKVAPGSITVYQQAPYWQQFATITEATFETGFTHPANATLNISPSSQGIILRGLQPNEKVFIYTTAGRLVRSFVSGSELIQELHFPYKGIFILKTERFTEKFIR